MNNYTTPGKKTMAAEFCAYASSKAKSSSSIAQDASTAEAGSDPFRHSQLDEDLWTANGYHRTSLQSYFKVISTTLDSENAVVDIRFPESSSIYASLDETVHDYLNDTIHGRSSEKDLLHTRKEIEQELTRKFQEIIKEYDTQASTRASALEQYQKLRNVYKANNTNLNQLGTGIRAYGFAVASLTVVLAGLFALWSYNHRLSPVVKASQPFFLVLICMGVFILASSIFPMAIDDGFASLEACDKACMAIPWLITMGWSIVFAALYAKVRRVNIVVRNALAFRSIKVSEKDVMLPFAVLFTCNLILMTVWTTLNPLIWVRKQTSSTESFGACQVEDTGSASWKVVASFIALLNGAALIGANVEAYKARNVDTEFGESNYIGLIMGSYLQVVAVGLPLFFLVNDNPTARFFLTSSMVFLMCVSVLLLLFVPKWRSVRLSRQNVPIGHVSERGTARMDSAVVSRKSDSVTMTHCHEVAPTQQRYNEALWRDRVKTLEWILEEAGIDAKTYMRRANILDQQGRVVSVLARQSSCSGLSIPENFGGRSSVESSLAPVSEVENENKDGESDATMNKSKTSKRLMVAP